MNKKQTAALTLAMLLCLSLAPFGLASDEPPEEMTIETPVIAVPEDEAPIYEEACPEPVPEDEPAVPGEPDGAALDGETVYTINGVAVSMTSSSITNNCYTYAYEIYRKIWGVGFSGNPNSSDNLLRNLSVDAHKLTAENVKNYISAAALGSVIRLTGRSYVTGSNNGAGHSQLLVQKDADGFTVLESNVTGGRREKYYTWSGYVSWWAKTANRDYFHYIEWPGAPAYSGPIETTPPPAPTSTPAPTAPPAPDVCTCSEAYAGYYLCTASSFLTIRGGHGTGFPSLGAIPSGEVVRVTLADGSWAHVEYNGVTGFASMLYLAPIEVEEEDYAEDLNGDGRIDECDALLYLGRGKPYQAALALQLAVIALR